MDSNTNMFPEEPQNGNGNGNGLHDEDDIYFGDNLEDFENIVGTESEDFEVDGDEIPEDSENEDEETQTETSDGDDAVREKAERPRLTFEDRTVSGIARGIRDWVVASWRALTKKGKIIAALSAFGLLAAVIIAVVALNYSPLVRTFSMLDEMESAQITSVLNANRIRYDLRREADGSNAIYVREADASRAITALMDAGHWFRGFVLEEDASGGGLFETDDDKRRRHIAETQNRLRAALNASEDVHDSMVTLVVPNNDRYVLEGDKQPSSASVMLILNQGATLSEFSVRSIENLIMRSVQGLGIEDITILDGNLNQLNIYTEEEIDNNSSYQLLLAIKNNYEKEKAREFEEKAIWLLESFFKEARVAVSVQTDFNKVIREVIRYFGANVDDEGMQRGIVAYEGLDRILEGRDPDDVYGIIGTDPNVDSTGYYDRDIDDAMTNFMDAFHLTNEMLVDKTLEQIERTTPEIMSITLAATADGDMDDDEIEDLIILLANVTGISAIARAQMTPDDEYDADYLKSYVSLFVADYYAPFDYSENLPGPQPQFSRFEFWLALGGGLILLVMLTTLLVALSRRAKRIREEEEVFAGYGPISVGVGGDMDAFARAIGKTAIADEIDGDEISIELKEEQLKKQIKVFIDQNPDIAAQLIKTLLRGDESGGGRSS